MQQDSPSTYDQIEALADRLGLEPKPFDMITQEDRLELAKLGTEALAAASPSATMELTQKMRYLTQSTNEADPNGEDDDVQTLAMQQADQLLIMHLIGALLAMTALYQQARVKLADIVEQRERDARPPTQAQQDTQHAPPPKMPGTPMHIDVHLN